jgi:Na+/H+ antiporter NhaC
MKDLTRYHTIVYYDILSHFTLIFPLSIYVLIMFYVFVCSSHAHHVMYSNQQRKDMQVLQYVTDVTNYDGRYQRHILPLLLLQLLLLLLLLLQPLSLL